MRKGTAAMVLGCLLVLGTGCSASGEPAPGSTLDPRELAAGAPSAPPAPQPPPITATSGTTGPERERTAEQWLEAARELYTGPRFCRLKGETSLADGSKVRMDVYAAPNRTTGLVWVGAGKLRVRRVKDRVLLRGDPATMAFATGIPLASAKEATSKKWIEFDLRSERLAPWFIPLVPELDLGMQGEPQEVGRSVVGAEPTVVIGGSEGGTRLLIGAAGEPVLQGIRLPTAASAIPILGCDHVQTVAIALESRVYDTTY